MKPRVGVVESRKQKRDLKFQFVSLSLAFIKKSGIVTNGFTFAIYYICCMSGNEPSLKHVLLDQYFLGMSVTLQPH